jgi:hypothetical protein
LYPQYGFGKPEYGFLVAHIGDDNDSAQKGEVAEGNNDDSGETGEIGEGPEPKGEDGK